MLLYHRFDLLVEKTGCIPTKRLPNIINLKDAKNIQILIMLDRTELEKHILSRCFEDDEKIEELLATRYNFTGTQKPSLVLLPTTGEDQEKQKSLLHKETIRDEQHNQRRINTRLEIREYLKNTKKEQMKLQKKIQDYNKLSQKKTKRQFPLHKLLTLHKIPMYEDFLPLYKLWMEYIQSLVFPGLNSPQDRIPGKQVILSKLATAEYNGCLMTVLDSRNPQLIGLRGIVVYDTQYSFIICVPRDESEDASPAKQVGGLRFIPKKYSLFTFDVILPYKTEQESECLSFTLIGSRIDMRAVDRSTKKFKNHNVEDII